MNPQTTYENALSKIQDIIALLNEHQVNKTVTLTMPNDAKWLFNRIENLKKQAFSIIVTGGFNSGKSTLINALIGQEVLHDGAIPTTSVITRLSKGESYHAKLVYKSGKEELLDWNDFSNRKIKNFERSEVLKLDIFIPLPVLAPGVEIIDTPGLNEHEQRTRLVLDYLPNADAIILVIDAFQPLRSDDVEFIKLLGSPPLENVFFVTNRMGLIKSPTDQSDITKHVQTRLSSLLNKNNDKPNEGTQHPRLFFIDAKMTLNPNESDEGETSIYNGYDFPIFKEELITFLDVEKRQGASIKGLAQELTELCYKIQHRYKSVENAFTQPLSLLVQNYNDSLQKLKEIHKSYEQINTELLKLSQDIGEQVFVNLLTYIDHMQSTWHDDVKELNFSELEKLNALSVKMSQQEKNRLSEILSAELKRYLDLKLLQWMQQLPKAISPIIENLYYKVGRDMAIIGVNVAELETSLADVDESSTKGVLDAEKLVLLPIQNFIANSLKDIVKWPFFENISEKLKQPEVLKTVGLSTIGAILAAGAAILGANPIGIFVATLGAGLIHTLRARHEQREYYKIMREESSSSKAYQDLNQENIGQFQKAVRAALEDETGKFFFDEVRKQIIIQKQKPIDGVASEVKLLSERMKSSLDTHIARIMEQHQQLLERKKAGEQAVNNELEYLNQFNQKFRKHFDAYCKLVLGNTLSDAEIKQLGETRAKYFRDYVRVLEDTLVIDTTQLIGQNETPETPATIEQDNYRRSFEVIQRRTQAILSHILGLDPTSRQLATGIKETAWSRLESMVGIQNVKDSIKELMEFQTTQSKRKREGKVVGNASLHLVFTGNPGTGKTSVASIIGEIYREIGLLKKGHTVYVKAGDLIAGFVGQTSRKTREKIERALDGVLFIDEAYSLVPKNSFETNFGKDVITELLAAMETYPDRLVVIIAGYNDEIQHFLDFDPGLRGRFPLDNQFHFQNYSAEELYQILIKKLSKEDYRLKEEAEKVTKDILVNYCEQMSGEKTFENARFVRSFAESLIRKSGARINRNSLSIDSPIEVEDISVAYNQYSQKKSIEINSASLIGIPNKSSLTPPIPAQRDRRKISDQEEVQKKTILQQTHSGTGDNVYGDKIIFETNEKVVSRKLTLIPNAESKPFFGQLTVFETIKLTLRLHGRVLLQSIGGRGKTSFCIQYINKHTQDFQHIAWLSCKTSLAQSFLESEQLLSCAGIVFTNNVDEYSRFRQLQGKLVEKIKQPTLIIIDNVGKRHEQELSELSLSSNFKILLTSRERIANFELVELPVLDFEASLKLFNKVSGRENDEFDEAILMELFEFSDYHATIIETLAKKFSTCYGQTLASFFSELKNKKIGNSIAELLTNIIDASSLSEKEQVLMRSLSILPSAFIPFSVSRTILGFQNEEFNDTTLSLIDKGLLEEDKVLGFKCQEIIQEAIRAQLQPDVQNCKKMLDSMGEKLTKSIAELNYRQLHTEAAHLLPLLRSTVDYLGSDITPFIYIYKNIGLFARILGDFEQAKRWIKNSLEAINNIENASISNIEVLQIYADICQAKGDYDEAEQILNDQIIRLQTTGPQTTKDIALAYEKLGMLHLQKGSLAEAVESLKEAVEIYEKLGEDNISPEHKAKTGTNLGLALINLGMPNEAKEILEESSTYYEEVKDNIGLGHVCHYLSIAYIALSEFHKARSLLKRAKDYLTGELPEDELIFAEFKNNSTIITISSFVKEQSSLDERDLEGMLKDQIKAIQILEHHRPQGHSDFALYYFNLARLYSVSGDNVLAQQWATKSIDILKHNSESGKSLILANFHFMMASFFNDFLNNNEIETYLKSAISSLPLKEEYKGHLAVFYLVLGATCLDSENLKEAEANFQQSFETYRQIFTEDHPIHAFLLHCIATCKRVAKQYSEALKTQIEVIEICKRIMPETDPDMAFPYLQMALIHYDLKNYKEALNFSRKASLINDGSTDLSELNNIGHVALVKYLKGQQTHYAYIVFFQEQPFNGSMPTEDLIIAEFKSLEEAINSQQLILENYGQPEYFL